MGSQQGFQERVLFGDAAQVAEMLVILGVEGFPVVDAVGLGLVGDAQVVLLYVQPGDAHGMVLAADAQRPVGLTEIAVCFFHACLHAQEHGAQLFLVAVYFVLNQGVALVKAAVFIVVVVEPLVFQAHFFGDGTAKLRQLPGKQVGIEGHGQHSEFGHGLFSFVLARQG